MRFAAIAALVIIGALNRETTALLIALTFLAAYPAKWRWWLFYGLLLAGILIGLRMLIPVAPTIYNAGYVWSLNTQTWRTGGALLYLPLMGLLLTVCYAHNPNRQLMLRVIIALTPYLLLVAVFGVWQEARLLMPVLILSVPFMPSQEGSHA